MSRFTAGASLLLAVAAVFTLQAQQIRGTYLESRSTDVYVAQCFANGEAGLTVTRLCWPGM